MKKTFLFSVVALLSISLAFMGCPNDSGSDDDDDNTSALSSAKELVLVLGDTPKEVTDPEEEGKDGTSKENAKPYTVSPNTEATAVKVGDISVSNKAVATLYSDAEFNSPAPAEGIPLAVSVRKLVYIKVIAEDATEAFYTVAITVTPEQSSNNAITLILGGAPDPVTGTEAEGKDGTTKEKAKPYTVSLNTEATATTAIKVDNIVLASKTAKKALYSDAGFSSPAPTNGIALAAGADKDVYIKVTAEDLTDAFYKVTISITSDAPYARVTIVDGTSIAGYAGVKVSKEVRVELFNATIKDEDKELKKNVNLIDGLGWITIDGIDGLTAKLKETVTPGISSFTFTIAGIQAAPLNEPLTLTIPKNYVSSGKDLAVNPGDANAQLTFTWKPVNQSFASTVNADIFAIKVGSGSLVGEDIKIYVKKDWKEVKITTIEDKSEDYIEAVAYEGDEPEEGVPLLIDYPKEGNTVVAGGLATLILPEGAAKGQIKFVVTEDAQDSQVSSLAVDQNISNARVLAVALGVSKVKVDPMNNKVTVKENITSIPGTPVVGNGSSQELIVPDGLKVTVGNGKSLRIAQNGTLIIEDTGTIAANYFVLGAGTWKSDDATITPNTLTLSGSNATLGNGALNGNTVLSGSSGSSTFTANSAAVTLSQDGNGFIITGKTKSARLATSSSASILVRERLSLELVTLDISGSSSGIALSNGKKISLEDENSKILVDSDSDIATINDSRRTGIAGLTLEPTVTVKGEADGWNKAIGSFTGNGTITAGTSNASTIRNGIETAGEERTATVTGTISGNQDIALTSTVTLTFANETIKTAIEAGTDLSTWITNLPRGLSAKTVAGIEAGTRTFTLTITGTPAEARSGNVAIAIPAANLTSNIIFTIDTGASFNILGVPSASITGNATITGSVNTALNANNTIAITLSNATLNSALNSANVAGWFSALPTGLSATATGSNGGNSITITVGATNNAAATNGAVAQTIAIPAGSLSSGVALPVTGSVSITINPVPAATINGGAVSIASTTTGGIANPVTITIDLANTSVKADGITASDVSSWFTGANSAAWPTNATASAAGNAGASTITITIADSSDTSNNVSVVADSVFTITIPAGMLTTSEALEVTEKVTFTAST